MALYEHFWDCPACGQKGISALRKRKCPKCGYSKTSQDEEHRSGIEITDADGIALARGGPHWVCSSCGSVNLNKYESCETCGNPKEADDHQNEVRELGTNPPPSYTPPSENEQWYDPKKSDDDSQSEKLGSYPQINYSEDLTEKSFLPSWATPSVVRNCLIGLVVVVALVLLGFGIFSTREVPGIVTGFSWSRDINIERFSTVHESGWSTEAGAYNIYSSQRVNHYDPIYEDRPVTTHHSQTCYRNLGNGSEESYDCSYDTISNERVQVGEEPVYATWYEYDVDKWVYERTVSATANDNEPYWPKYTLSLDGQVTIGAERVGGKLETYKVYFETQEKGKTKKYSITTSQSEWQQYGIEMTYILKINHFGKIMNDPLRDRKALVTQQK